MAKKDFSQLIAHVEQKQEVKEEVTNLDEQLKVLKIAVSKLIESSLKVEQAGKDANSVRDALNAAKGSVNNAVTGISNAIVKAHQTPMKVEMTDGCKAQMEQSHKDMLEKEAKLLTEHEGKVNQSVDRLSNRFENVVNNFKGIWVDKKTFNIYYWLFILMLEIMLISLVGIFYVSIR